jgi:hypothetical protein
MSQNHQGLTIAQMFAYMQNIAVQHVELQHGVGGRKAFARMVLTEAYEKGYTQLDDTALIVESYEEEGIDNKSNNLMARRFLAWHVVKRLTGQNNDADQLISYEEDCQRIAKQVLARLRHDRLNYDDQRFADVEMEAWRGDSSSALFNGKWAAWRIEVPVKHVDRQVVFDQNAWDDTTNPATFTDLSALTCPQLNDAILGLTDAQRTNCLYVTIYETDGVTERTRVAAGGTYTLPTATPMILPYANYAAAQADTSTVPTTAQLVVLNDSDRTYHGDGTSTVAALVAAQRYLLPVTEASSELATTVEGTQVKIQLNQ